MGSQSTGEGKGGGSRRVTPVEMFPLLMVLFIVVPVVELAVVIQVGQSIGVFNTIGLLLLVSFVGAWLVRREGTGVWRRFNEQVRGGQVPGKEMADGVMILFAGALLLTPGFFTDTVGLLLLFPPVRAVIRAALLSRVTLRVGRL